MQFKYTLIVLSSQHPKIHWRNKDIELFFWVTTHWLRSTALPDESSDGFEPFCTLSVPSNLTQKASGAEQESSETQSSGEALRQGLFNRVPRILQSYQRSVSPASASESLSSPHCQRLTEERPLTDKSRDSLETQLRMN